MSNREYDKYLEAEYLHNEYACCDCGFRRGYENHPGIRCSVTGRCGQGGNDWPCPNHEHLVPEKLKKRILQPSYVKEKDV